MNLHAVGITDQDIVLAWEASTSNAAPTPSSTFQVRASDNAHTAFSNTVSVDFSPDQ